MKLHELNNIDEMTPEIALTKITCTGGDNKTPCTDCVNLLTQYTDSEPEDLIRKIVKERVLSHHKAIVNKKYR